MSVEDKQPEWRVDWDGVRRIADELELEIHLAGMEARDRWRALQPRIVEFEHRLAREGARASEVVTQELSAIGAALKRLRDDLAESRRR
jgi:hypothetical protein